MNSRRLKTAAEIATLQEGGKRLAEIITTMADHVAPGVSTLELDDIARRLITRAGAVPAFLGYSGFPAAACISVNEQVVHGIPRKETILEEGDIVTLDIGLIYKKLITDMAITIGVGKISKDMQNLLAATEAGLRAGIAAAWVGHTLGDVGHAIESEAVAGTYGVVRQLVGHGVGYAVHEPPQVPNYGTPGTGLAIEEGLVIAIEPMFTIGSAGVQTLDDGWTIVTTDGSRSAHFEHTIAVTAAGPVIITQS